MTQRIELKRFLVKRNGVDVYNQPFKSGLNIIAGDNNTGKSTILELIFYCLGGELSKWTEEALLCDYVMADVSFSGKVVEVRRKISIQPRRPLEIKDSMSGEWLSFPYSESSEKKSFSQELFELIGFPLYKKDDSVNLTMHQILRLMYVDQDTSPYRMFREEALPQFDTKSNKKAIGEYLFSIDDLDSYDLRKKISEGDKDRIRLDSELKSIYRVVGKYRGAVDRVVLNEIASDLSHKKKKIEKEIEEAKSGKPGAGNVAQETEKSINHEKDLISKNRREKQSLTEEISDIEIFSRSIQDRLESLSESAVASNFFSFGEYLYCPACLKPISKKSEHFCSICGSENSTSDEHHLGMKKELEFQLSECQKTKLGLEEKVKLLRDKINNSEVKITRLESISKSISMLSDVNVAALVKLSEGLGAINQEIKSLNETEKVLNDVENIERRKVSLLNNLDVWKNRLERLDKERRSRRDELRDLVESFTIDMLSNDGGYEVAFDEAEDLFFDFGDDKFFVNGKRKYSASSSVILKNSLIFSFFLASVEYDFIRFPRFIMLDNIEDKGMQPERSQNFQRKVASMSDSREKDHQIIMATSLVAEELRNSSYCIGPYYSKGTHTLDVPSKHY